MKYFVFFSTILLILYLVEFVKKDNRTFTFMDKDFTKLIKVLCCIESFTFSKYRIKTRDFLV